MTSEAVLLQPKTTTRKILAGQRLSALDSIRGIAAIIVVFNHIFNFTPDKYASVINLFKHTPLRIIIDGHASVIVFFVLSGAVLTIPVLANPKIDVGKFLVRRFFRIYVPFAVAILGAYLLFEATVGRPILGVSAFTAQMWSDPHANSLLGHLLLTGKERDIELDGVMWSLVHELRMSLVFPFIIPWIIRYPVRSTLVSLVIAIGADVLLRHIGETYTIFISAHTVAGSLLMTVRYMVFFVAGAALIALLNENLQRLDDMKPAIRWGLLAVALVLLMIPGDRPYSDYLMGVGALAVIALAIASRNSPLLSSPPLHWLGEVSYSLYLVHLPIMLACLKWLSPSLSLGVCLLIALPIVFVTSHLFNLLVEKPANRLGKRVLHQSPQAL